jgi:hypothetical protein
MKEAVDDSPELIINPKSVKITKKVRIILEEVELTEAPIKPILEKLQLSR